MRAPALERAGRPRHLGPGRILWLVAIHASICFRCDWSGPEPATRACPRCGTTLYRQHLRSRGVPTRARTERKAARPPLPEERAPPSDRFEAAVVAEEVGPDDETGGPLGAANTPRRLLAALAAVSVAVAIASLGGGEETLPEPPGPREERPGREEALPVHGLSLPRGLSDATTERPLELTLPIGDPADPGIRTRLWRLRLPAGTLLPGPIAEGRVVDVRHDARSGHTAYLMAGSGDLFLVEDFLAGSPRLVARGVAAFDLDRRGRLVYGRVDEEASDGGATLVTVGRTDPTRRTLGVRAQQRLRLSEVERAAAGGARVAFWGTRRGDHVVAVLDLRHPGRRRYLRPNGGRPLALSPDGTWLLARREASGEIGLLRAWARPAVTPSLHALAPSLRVDRVVAWSDDAALLVATGRSEHGAAGLWLISQTGGADLLAAGIDQPAGGVALTPDGGGLISAAGGRLTFVALPSGSRFDVNVPERVGTLLGPVAVQAGPE